MFPELRRMANSNRRSENTRKPLPLSLKSEDSSNPKWRDPLSCRRRPATALPLKPSPWFRNKCRRVWEEPTNSSSERASLPSSRSSPASPAKPNNSLTEASWAESSNYAMSSYTRLRNHSTWRDSLRTRELRPSRKLDIFWFSHWLPPTLIWPMCPPNLHRNNYLI